MDSPGQGQGNTRDPGHGDWIQVTARSCETSSQCSSQESFTMDSPDGTASLPSPSWFWPAGSCMGEIWGNKSHQLRKLQGGAHAVQLFCTQVPSLPSKLSSTIPTCWVWDYITPGTPEPLLSAPVTVDTPAELRAIYFLTWIIVKEFLVQKLERNRVGGWEWVTLALVTGCLCHVLQPAGVHMQN